MGFPTTLQEFQTIFPDEQACWEALRRARWPKGFVCPRCGAGRYSEITNRGLYQCSACRHQVSLTAGTILQSTNLPLTFWFRTMYLIIKTNKRISSIELAHTLLTLLFSGTGADSDGMTRL